MKYLSLFLFVFILACDNTSSNYAYAEESSASELNGFSSDFETEVGISQNLVTPAPTEEKQEQKIIKTARLSFETKDPDETHKKILELADRHEGIVQKDNSGKNNNRNFRNMIVRIPTGNFQKFIDGVSEGVGYFDERDISQKDVTEEFVDLKARLKAKRELENRYLDLLKMAKNVEEVLKIERELSIIREEIEAKQGRLQYLQDRVAMSTVSINFYKTTAESSITVSYGQKMGNALRGGWNGVSVFFLGLLYLWPLLLLVIIAILVVRSLIKRNRTRLVQ